MLKETLLLAIDRNTNAIITAIGALKPEQLLLKSKGKWSVIEQLEHIVLTDKVVSLLLTRTSDSVAENDTIFGQERLEKIIVTLRARKVQAPDFLHPKGSITTFEAFKLQFTSQRDALKKMVEDGSLPLNNAIHKHPYLGEMTVIDWLHFIPLHAQRHFEQIKDILATA